MAAEMICANCGAILDRRTDICGDCGTSPLLRDRYVLDEVLGGHGGATTYRATDTRTSDMVVVKELWLRATESLKEIELFEREAEILASLDHRGIPKLRDHFDVRSGKTIALVLVQDHVAGQSLAAYTRSHRFNASEIASTLADLCDILAYLRTADPPVVHRDIKPTNIIRDEDGRLTLVDFGASRVAETLHTSGSTIAGTFGFMAPEQLLGKASPATDVFSAGATAICLLTERPPHELWTGGRFEYDRTGLDAALVGLLDLMTATEPSMRPTDMEALARDLRAYADGKRGALTPYVGRSSDLAERKLQLARPTSLTAFSGLGRTIYRSALALAGLVFLVVPILIVALVGGTHDPTSLLPLVVPVAGVVFGVGSQVWWRVRRAWLARTGHSARGLVTKREIHGGRFTIEYRFDHDGKQHHRSERVTEHEFLELLPGDEVVVCFAVGSPSASTAFALPQPKLALPR